MKRYNPYQDRFASDGVIASGWRYVRKGGRVKIAGEWWSHPLLEGYVGSYMQVVINDYWMSSVSIYRGVIGCTEYFCTIEKQ